MIKRNLFISIIALLLMAKLPCAAQVDMSIRTNLLWDIAASEPNIGVEFPLSDNWSIGGNLALKAWPRYLAWDWNTENPSHWRNFAVVPEVRYYLDQVYQGFFFGADAIYTHFNVGALKFPLGMYPEVENNREQGAFWAGGLFAGYAWWPWEHWRFELEAGAAVGLAAYGKYDCAHCGTKLSEERKAAVVPKLAVNVAYNTVAKKDRKPRGIANYVVSGSDTITVMTPPVAFVVHLKDVEAPQTAGDSISRKEPWVISIDKYRPLDYLTRPGRDSVMYVRFPLDSWELRREMAPNAQVLDKMVKVVNLIKADERADEILISIVGLASIEGPQQRNDTLSVNRAKVVAEYLAGETGLSRRNFETIGKGEAWDWFRAQINASPEGLSRENLEKLLEIVDGEPDADIRERRIKADKKLYQAVKDNLLADQRNSGYIRVYYSNAPDPVTEKYNREVMPLLKAKRYHDAVRVFNADPALKERAKADAEAANAYGMALWFTSLDNEDVQKENEAVEMVKDAARNGSECASQNLDGMKIYGPALKEYRAWQKAMTQE